MPGNRSVQVAINNLVNHSRSDDNINLIDAEIQSVDQDNRLCTCIGIGGRSAVTYSNCRLMTDIDDGILIIPIVGSTVTILLSTFTDPVVIMYSEVDKIILRGGDLGGLPRVEDLVTKYNNLENFCNNLQTKLNDLITKYNNHTHILTLSTGTGTAAPTVTTETPDTDQQLTKTVRDDIENTAITQG